MTGFLLRKAIQHLRAMSLTWAATALLPLPALLIGDAGPDVNLACVYLGLSCAWLAARFFERAGATESRRAWCATLVANSLAVGMNVALFVALAKLVGAKSTFPLGPKAILAALPAVGMIPWLIARVREPFATIVIAAVLMLLAKLAGCALARAVYGPRFIEDGYVAGDWRSAKLMIASFWVIASGLSLAFLIAAYLSANADDHTNVSST
jgi:hypothetical protein